MSSNSPTLLIDSRSGSVVMQLASGEVLTGMLDLSPGDRTSLSSPWLAAPMQPAPDGKQLYESALARWEGSKR
jgi:hypothetical protein